MNEIEAALEYAYERSIAVDGEPPDWNPVMIMTQLFQFCDEVRSIESILVNALATGDVKMVARAAAQLQHSTATQFAALSSAITFTAGKAVTEGPTPGENEIAGNKGKFENLFEALVKLDMVAGDIDGGRTAARMTDIMQEWVAEKQEAFVYLMASNLRDAGWSEESAASYTKTEMPPFNTGGLMEDLDEELLDLITGENSDEDES